MFSSVTISQKALLGKPLLEVEKELAKQRQAAGVSIKTQETLLSKGSKVSLLTEDRNERTAKAQVAKTIGLSPTTFHRALAVIEKKCPILTKNRDTILT